MKKQETNVDIAIYMGEKEYKHFHYHQSWDWLMPVVAKIRRDDFISLLMTDIQQGLLDVDLDATYEAVVKYIKKYNKVMNK